MPEKLVLETSVLRVVKPPDLNHHGTLFAGQMASWLVEAGFIASASLGGKPDDIVCVQLSDMMFKKPINLGDIIEIKTRIAHLGSTSITVYTEVFKQGDKAPSVSNFGIFVGVDKNNKPVPHGFKLSDEYVSQNKEIHEAAARLRKGK